MDFAPPLLALEAVGYQGFIAGSRLYIVDRLGLCDPLLCRLPGRRLGAWRIGHVERHMPDGYLETLRLGGNHIADPGLADYYERLRIVTRAPLFDSERLATLFHFLCGRYDPLRERYVQQRYRAEAAPEASLAELQTAVPAGTPWYAPGVRRIDGLLRVRLPGTVHAAQIELGADANDRYGVMFLRGPDVVATLVAEPLAVEQEAGIAVRALAVPGEVAAAGYDGMLIAPQDGDGVFGIGQLLLDGS